MRNRVLIPSLIALIAIVFIYGLLVGVYKIFPYEPLNSSFDVIKGESDVDEKKYHLIEFFWNVESLDRVKYSGQLPQVEFDISDSRYDNFQNLKRIDKLTVEMEYGINSVSYLLVPEESNKKLILYHHGHDGDFILGKDTIQFFLERNFTVLAMTMPLIGMNNQPIVEIDGFGEMKLISHEQFRLLEKNKFNPMKLFIHPIQVSLNFLEKEYNFKRYSIIKLLFPLYFLALKILL